MSPKKPLFPTLPFTELKVLAGVEQLANEMISNYGLELEEDQNALDVYSEQYMEDLSEAGYTETPDEDKLSVRAFASILRVDPADLARVKDLFGYQPSAYRRFALADNLVRALAHDAELAPALRLLAPAEGAKATGPFYPNEREFSLKGVVETLAKAAASETQPTCGPRKSASCDELVKAYIRHLAAKRNLWEADTAAPEHAAAVKLAGAFEFCQGDVYWLTQKVAAVCADKLHLGQLFLAHTVLAAVASVPRFVSGCESAQPAKAKSQQDQES